MTSIDESWFHRCHAAGLVKGRMLEVGSAKVQGIPNLCEIARALGIIETMGADIIQLDGVDLIADFGTAPADFRNTWRAGQFSTVCVFNVLEHTFDPLTVLSNALFCVEPGGTLLVVTPSIWPIHHYPRDYNRMLPDWYVTFAERTGVELLHEHFSWLSEFGIEKIGPADDASYPTFQTRGRNKSPARYWISRLAHKALNTWGRSHWATHTAIGAAFRIIKVAASA